MTLPRNVVEYLQDKYTADLSPACFRVDATFRLLESWGDTAWCNLESVQPGADMLGHAPYLFGTLDERPQVLEYVSLPNGVVIHVHSFPVDEDHYVVLLNAKQRHDSVQNRQQTVNELKLMQAGQLRLIGRQRDLISELVEARAELDHHRREAERSSSSKGQFIATMSHEFRTPLASIINYAKFAREPDATSNNVQKSIEAIERSANHLSTLVESVLDEARLDAGQMELRETVFDLHKLLSDLADMMAPLAADKELSFSCQIDTAVPRMVRSDEVKLRQILINLLGNAVKFTIEGGIQLVTTFADGRLVSSVADTGPGISIEDQERVFQAFERSSSSQSGAGLGLTISLQLAQLMGGEVSLDSMPGVGCTVAVNLPIREADDAGSSTVDALSAPNHSVFATKPVSVLVCDDDDDMLALMEHYLHRAGYGIIVAASGSDALSKSLSYAPDIVIMDCNMPDMSGIETTERLREAGFASPIVGLTASNLSAAERETFTSYFRKPAPMQDLLAEIKNLTHR